MQSVTMPWAISYAQSILFSVIEGKQSILQEMGTPDTDKQKWGNEGENGGAVRDEREGAFVE